MPRRTSSRKANAESRELSIQTDSGVALSAAQSQFNRLLKNLEAARRNHRNQEKQLDDILQVSIQEWMPLVEEINRAKRDLVFSALGAMRSIELSPKRQAALSALIRSKIELLLADPAGLSIEEQQRLEGELSNLSSGLHAEPQAALDPDGFEELCSMLRTIADAEGVELDLSGIDARTPPDVIQRMVKEQMKSNVGTERAKPARGKKKSKAQIEKEHNQAEVDAAKKRDLKTLYKQLARALHPDLEFDTELKARKATWMQRLNAAHAAADLREMLQLEMEWLGEEATNLSQASDEKLGVYCMVLQEQIEDLKKRTQRLIHEPQFQALRRFLFPRSYFQSHPRSVRMQLQDELNLNRKMIDLLDRNNANSRKLIHEWADEYDRKTSEML